MSHIADVLETIGKKITSHPNFKNVPIYWDEMELSPNSTSFPCIQFKPRSWQPNEYCDEQERILEIRILTNGEDKRKVILQLFDFEEGVRKVLDKAINSSEFTFFELKLLGASEISGMTYNKNDIDSYKGTKTMFSSLIVLSYLLRY